MMTEIPESPGATPEAEADSVLQRDALRAEVRRIAEADKRTITDIAKEVGLPMGTFSPWLGGTYAGRNERIDEAVVRWLQSRSAEQRRRTELAAGPVFVMTPGARSMMNVLEHAQHAPDLATLVGAAGVGKTTTIREYMTRASNVWLVSGEPCLSTPRALLDELADILNVVAQCGSFRLSRHIAQRLQGTRGLLVVDEAQALPTVVLEQIRTLHDASGIGMVLAGNEKVHSRIEGGTRRPEFAQLFSRVGMRFSRTRASMADIRGVLDAWEIEDPEARRRLTVIGRKPGALRGMVKTLRIARMQAAAAGQALSGEFVSMAYEHLADKKLELEG